MGKERNEIKDLRQFGIVLACILMAFGIIHLFKGRIVLFRYFMSFGVVVLIPALLAPRSLKGVYTVFLKIAHAIGWFNTRAILMIIYFLVLVPIAFFMKIFGKDPLNRKMDKAADTYWIKRAPGKVDRTQLEKQF